MGRRGSRNLTKRMGPRPAGSGRLEILRGRPDTQPGPDPTPGRENRMLKKARNKATEILLISAELYRDMALSALRLVGRRA